MGRTFGDFIDPENGKPDDRAWLDYQVLSVITTRSPYEMSRFPEGPPPRSTRDIYEMLVPIHPSDRLKRGSWSRKPRKVKRDMLAASLRRLITGGKIRLLMEIERNRRSMHGLDRLSIRDERCLFGQDYDGKMRYYIISNALDAMVEALSKDD